MSIKKFLSMGIFGLTLAVGQCFAQDAGWQLNSAVADRWVDSVYNSLTLEQRVAQLICMRANQPDKPFDENVAKYVKKYNLGGVCFFRSDADAIVRRMASPRANAADGLH